MPDGDGFMFAFEGMVVGQREADRKNGGTIVNVTILDDEGGTCQFFTYGDDPLAETVRKLERLSRVRGQATVRQGQYGRLNARLVELKPAALRAATGTG
jgi:hypothetical protein